MSEPFDESAPGEENRDGLGWPEVERPSHQEVRRAALRVLKQWPKARFIEEDIVETVFEALGVPPRRLDTDAALKGMLSHVLAELCDEAEVLAQLVEEQRRAWLKEHRPEASRRTTVWELMPPASERGDLGKPAETATQDNLRGTLVSGTLEREADPAHCGPAAAPPHETADYNEALRDEERDDRGRHVHWDDGSGARGERPVSERSPARFEAAEEVDEVQPPLPRAIRESAVTYEGEPRPHNAQTLKRPRTPVEQLAASLRLAGLFVETPTVAAAWTALQATGRLLLAGPTGSGKTRLAEALATSTPSSGPIANYLWVPAQPTGALHGGWLGETSTATGVASERVGFLQQAIRNYQDRHAESLAWFLLFDDLDVMPAEAGLEELLAVLESPCDPHKSLRLRELLAFSGRALHLSPNVYWIGTLNTDLAGPQRLSPRLLDRVFWLELEEAGVDQVLAPPRNEVVPRPLALQTALLDALRGDEQWHRGRFARPFEAEPTALPPEAQRGLDALERLQRIVQPLGGSVSARAACEIAAYLHHALQSQAFAALLPQESGEREETATAQAWMALDWAIAGKVLPRLLTGWRSREGREHRGEALARLYAWALDPDAPVALEGACERVVLDEQPPAEAVLPRCAAVARREWQRTPPSSSRR